jgi:hypothetical protein
MRLFGNVMRNMVETAAIPPKGVWRFWGGIFGDGCGVQGEGRGREIVSLAIRDTDLV